MTATAGYISRKFIPAPKPLSERLREYRPTLEDVLLLWASRHLRPAFEAYAGADDATEQRILARIVRERARDDPGWVVKLANSRLGYELAALGPYIVRAGGYPLNGEPFADWVENVRACP